MDRKEKEEVLRREYVKGWLKALEKWMNECDYEVTERWRVYDKIRLVIFYHNQFKMAETPETEALARWSLSDAENDLATLMNAKCFPEELRRKVRSLSRAAK